MPAQLTYEINQPKAYAGLIYAQNPHEIISRDTEGVAGIAFAVIVSRGTDPDKQAIIGGSVGANLLGVTIRELTREGDRATAAVMYSEKETMGILREGYVWAACPTGCSPGDQVSYDEATGVIDAGAPAGTGESGLNDCSWESTAQAGELGILRIANISNITAGV